MTWEPILAFALPVVVALVLWLARPRLGLARPIAVTAAAALVLVSARMVALAASGAIGVHVFGGWQPPLGIVFVADRLASLMLLLTAGLLLATLLALRPEAHGERTVERSLPLLFLLTFGLFGAFLTGDLFNLFVMFELVLLSSYLLLQVPGSLRSLRAAFGNVVINLLASLLFFGAVGLLYGMCGTVNMAELGLRIGQAPAGLRLAASSMLVVAFSIKAGLLPLGFWLPATYPVTSAPIAAMFAGIMTKLGVYAMLRTTPALMADTPLPGVLVAIGAVSAIVSVLAALSQYELRRLLGFHSLSQMGYAVAALGLSTVTGIAAAVVFLVHHAVVKSSLYLVSDELERRFGTGDLRRMTPATSPALASLFLIAGLGLAGLPPSSGFVAKLAVFSAFLDDRSYLAVVPLAAASIVTLASMLKVWQYGFQPAPSDGEATPGSSAVRPTPPRSVTNATASPESRVALAGLVIASLAIAVAAQPLVEYAQAIAGDLLGTAPALLASEALR